MAKTRRLTNEVIVFIRESDYRPIYLQVMRLAGTVQITVDKVRSFRTPFGTYMIIATLSFESSRPEARRLREYVTSVLSKAGLMIALEDVLTPARSVSVDV